MSIPITDKFKPKGAGGYALMDAEDVEMPDGTRLSDFKGGASITVDSELSATSENPIQNKAVAQRLSELTDEFSETIENVTELIPGLDTTLSETGKAADAAAVGAAIEQVRQEAGSSITVDSALSATSENPVQNKVIAGVVNQFVSGFEQIYAAIPTDAHINDLIDAYLSEALGGDY